MREAERGEGEGACKGEEASGRRKMQKQNWGHLEKIMKMSPAFCEAGRGEGGGREGRERFSERARAVQRPALSRGPIVAVAAAGEGGFEGVGGMRG